MQETSFYDAASPFLKGLYLTTIYLISILFPLKDYLQLIGLFIAIDYVLGVWKAINQREEISSQRTMQTILKSIVYLLMVIAGSKVAIVVGELPENSNIVWVICVFILYTETVSIDENFKAINKISIINYLKKALGKAFKR